MPWKNSNAHRECFLIQPLNQIKEGHRKVWSELEVSILYADLSEKAPSSSKVHTSTSSKSVISITCTNTKRGEGDRCHYVWWSGNALLWSLSLQQLMRIRIQIQGCCIRSPVLHGRLFSKVLLPDLDFRNTARNLPRTDPDFQVKFDDEDTTAARLHWGHSLVGYFIGKSPPLFAVKNSLEKAWRLKDLEIITMADGLYLFKFYHHDAGQAILDEGPWFVQGHPLILRRWSEDIAMHRQQLDTIPI